MPDVTVNDECLRTTTVVQTVLDGDRSSVRRNMLEKYKIDFEKLKK